VWVPDWLIDPMPAEIYPSSGQAKHGLLKVLIVATSLVSRFPRIYIGSIYIFDFIPGMAPVKRTQSFVAHLGLLSID